MSDLPRTLVERLWFVLEDEHGAGCHALWVQCSCEYEETKDDLIREAIAEIERLEKANKEHAAS